MSLVNTFAVHIQWMCIIQPWWRYINQTFLEPVSVFEIDRSSVYGDVYEDLFDKDKRE